MPTYDLDGIAVRIPMSTIPDRGTMRRSLALDELVEVFRKCLDLCCRRRVRKRLELTLTEISITSNPVALPVPLLEKRAARVIEKVVSNIVTSCHFLLHVCVNDGVIVDRLRHLIVRDILSK